MMSKTTKIPIFKKTDIIIIASVTLLAILSFCLFLGGSEEATTVTVKIGGKVAEQYTLDDIGEYEIKGESGINISLVIEKNGVYVKSSDCPDKVCEKTGKISRSGQSIICMPGKVSITLDGSDDQADAIVG